MFNWFKSKVELKDEKSIMSSISNNNGIKLGSEIIVPNNFECLIYHHGKYFNTLTSGKHKLENPAFESLIKYQQKHKSKIKRVKFISHYISTAQQQVEFNLKKIKYNVSFIIDDKIKFAELMLLYAYKVTPAYTYEYIIDVFKELLIYCNYDCNQIKDSSLKDFGITIKSFTNNKNKTSTFFNDNTANFSSNSIKENTMSTDQDITQNPSTETTENKHTNIDISTNNTSDNNSTTHNNVNMLQCTKCGNITKFATTYCLKCGNKLQ